MADPASELAMDIARKSTPVGFFEQLMGALRPAPADPAKQRSATGRPAPKQNERLPRIVPDGRGNLVDLNTGAVVGKTDQKPASAPERVSKYDRHIDRSAGDILANRELARQGSVMAKGPGGMAPLSMDPSNLSGGLAGIIAHTPDKFLENLLREVRKLAPKLMQEVESTARTVVPVITPHLPEPNALGTYQNLNPLVGRVAAYGGQPRDELLSTIAHEFRHFLTEPKLANRNPAHMAETAQQLTAMMPRKQQMAMQRYTKPFDWRRSISAVETAPNEISSKMRMFEKYAAPGTMPKMYDAPAERAYNESLSYLTEALMQNARPSGQKLVGTWTPEGVQNWRPDTSGDELEAIANALGQGIR